MGEVMASLESAEPGPGIHRHRQSCQMVTPGYGAEVEDQVPSVVGRRLTAQQARLDPARLRRHQPERHGGTFGIEQLAGAAGRHAGARSVVELHAEASRARYVDGTGVAEGLVVSSLAPARGAHGPDQDDREQPQPSEQDEA